MGRNIHRDIAGLDLAGDETVPGLGALADDIHGVAVHNVSYSR